MNDQKPAVEAGVRVTAFILIAGGLFGLCLGLVGYVESFLHFHVSWATAITGLFMLMFGWCVWIGVELWQGRPQGYKWAKVLFAAQILAITLPGFTYRFEVFGLTGGLLLQGAPRINFHFGSSISIYVSSAIQDVAVGVNVVAVGALIYLVRVTSPGHARSKDKLGLI